MSIYCRTEGVKVTASKREVSQLLLGATLVGDYVRAPHLNTKPWLCSCYYGRVTRQRLWAQVGGSCQAGERERPWKVCGGEAASGYLGEALSALGGPGWGPGWTPADACGYTEESVAPQLLCSEGKQGTL